MTARTAPAPVLDDAPALAVGGRLAIELPSTPGAVVQVVNDTRTVMPRSVLAAVIASVCDSLEVTLDRAELTAWLTARHADRVLVLDDELCGPEVWATLATIGDDR